MSKEDLRVSFITTFDIALPDSYPVIDCRKRTQITITTEGEPAAVQRRDLGPERLRADSIIDQFGVQIAGNQLLVNVFRREGDQTHSVCLQPVGGEIYLISENPAKEAKRLNREFNITGLSVAMSCDGGDLFIRPGKWTIE
jgi:hypothetical protein